MKIKCSKKVVMNFDGIVAFVKGKTYEANEDEDGGFCITNEQNSPHWGSYKWVNENFVFLELRGINIIPTKLMGTTDPIFLPYRKHANDAGADLRARIEQPIRLHPGQLYKVPSGVAVEIPHGYVGLLQPRSGASSEGKLVITGTIDSGYVGEMSMNIFNPLDSNYVVINPKERIAQLVVVPYLQTEFVQVDELGESERGIQGFGSTGKE